MKYCEKCGKELFDEAVICPGCGCSVSGNSQKSNTDVYYKQLSNRVKINGIIWICIAGIQLILAMTVDWFLLIVGVLNVISAIKDLQYSKELLNKPAKVVEKYQPLTMPIIVLVYNAIFGGVIGVVGSIYYLVSIRNFVLTNKDMFKDNSDAEQSTT